MSDFDLDRLRSSAVVEALDYQSVVSSTNDRARELSGDVAQGDTLLVIADEQTAGRGRGSNRWWTGADSLAFSLLFDPSLRGIDRRWTSMIGLAAASAVIDVAQSLLPDKTVGLHWPNDVFVSHRKLAGVLVEALADGRHIVGVGVNVNNSLATAPDELKQIATSLLDLAGREVDRTQFLIGMVAAFHAAMEVLATAPQQLGRYCDGLCLQHGQTLTIDTGHDRVTGTCDGVADDGALVLETKKGRETIYSGVIIK
ncbi:MAG TPA: biotin--[acetyl-CoA-carboxylase] ligase [Pirellulales bacterium]|jgi:BirA family biotin operon repressor/biotin-[acetyl-CoA-carboxylase] ligase|nr:biotin--[acetyl-CoA-carboxylase] ligase [Pirellulales bacterium]